MSKFKIMKLTPKEKAEELIRNFENNVSTNYMHMTIESSIKCAIICADEIINGSFADGYDHNFWMNVKKELNEWEI